MDNRTNEFSRRTFFSGVAGLVTAGVITTAGVGITGGMSTQSGDETWTQPGANAAGTNAQISATGPAGKLSTAWQGGLSAYFGDTRVGAVVDGTVYASGTVLVAKNAVDGTTLWSAQTSVPDIDYPDGAAIDIERPTYVDGVVVAPVRIGVWDGDGAEYAKLMGVDAESGEKLWEIGTPSVIEFSHVRISDGMCYVCGPDLDGSDTRYIYQLNPSDGTIGWRQSVDIGRAESNTPAIESGRLYVAERNGVVALDVENGDRLWKALPRVKAPHVAMVADGTLFVSEESTPGATIIVLDASTGEQQWKQSYDGERVRIRVATVDAEQVYIAKGQSDAAIIALDRTDGTENWQTSVTTWPEESDTEPQTGRPDPAWGMARVGSLLYAGGFVLDPSDGSIRSEYGIEGPWTAPYRLNAVAGGQLYFGGEGLLVVKGSETQTASPPTTDTQTASPPTTDTQTEADESEDSTTVTDDRGSTATTTQQAEPSAPSETADTADNLSGTTNGSTPQESSSDDDSTATTGPGFGVLAGAAGIGVGSWLRSRDR